MSRMGEAQKLSIPQLQQAIQSGSLPPYIGIPLLQDKMKQAQMAKASQQQPQQPPIAQQVMQEAAQHGVEQLPTNLPTEEMAGGGIVAFAGGGLSDEDIPEAYQDQLDEEEDLQAMEAALENQAYANEGVGSIRNAGVGLKPESKGTGIKFESPIPAGGSKGIQDILRSKAEENKLPHELLNKIAGIESGYKSNAANPNSSAKGLFQFTDSTWKAMGGKEGEQFNPEKNAELGAKYVRQNAEGLKRTLGRDPTYGEVYASHMFGLEGAKKLLRQDPDTPMSSAVSAAVLKANPNLQDKSVGQVLSMLNQKTGQGIVSLAKGGEVKHFAEAGLVTGTDNPYALFGDIGASSSDYDKEDYGIAKAIKNELMGVKQPPKKSERAPVGQAGLTYDEMVRGSSRAGTEAELNNATSGMANVNAAPPPAKSDNSVPTTVDPYQKLMEKMEAGEAQSGKQKSIDNYMALLTAGLGMMGGSSQHAMENIGKGALAGVQNLGESRKLAAAEAANRDKTMASLIRGKQLHEIAQQTQGRLAGTSAQALEERQKEFLGKQVMAKENAIRNQILAGMKLDPTQNINDPDIQAKIQRQIAVALQNDPAYNQLHKNFYGFDYSTPSSGGGNVIRYDSSGKQIK
jgi:hypothetical protein